MKNQPNESCKLNFQLSPNSFFLTRQQTVKYLGVLIDHKLKWSTRIHHLLLQLSRYSGIFYRIRNLIPFKVSKMLYYCFIYSRIKYGIVSLGNALKICLKELSLYTIHYGIKNIKLVKPNSLFHPKGIIRGILFK